MMSRYTLVSCFLFHFQLVIGCWWLVYDLKDYWPICFNVLHGITYLLYPVFGWIAEVYFSNFKLIKWSLVLSVLSSIIAISISTARILRFRDETTYFVTNGVFIISCILGLGMYESNAIQFGMDQMIGASSQQLCKFVHWYFWYSHIGPSSIYLISAIMPFLGSTICIVLDSETEVLHYILRFLSWVLLYCSIFQLCASLLGLVLTCCYKRKYHIEQSSRNPLKIVYQVLKYAYHHKYPERRSAFTYWENDIPSRIDLGKDKYGGPFTYEQVEDVKTSLRIILLIICTFGFQLTGDGYSLTIYTMKRLGCPTILPFILFFMYPQYVHNLVAIVMIPIYRLLLQRFYRINYINIFIRVKLGLLLCLINESIKCLYSALLEEGNNEFSCPEVDEYLTPSYMSTIQKCQMSYISFKYGGNRSCEHFCSSPPPSFENIIFYFPFAILILQGLAYVLVFMSMLEFICAQSPNSMKGLLIGVWYSMLAIRYFFIESLFGFNFPFKFLPWHIHNGLKGVGIFLSIAAFSIACRKYQYRQRNEVVNEQAIIEEVFERELQNSDYLISS